MQNNVYQSIMDTLEDYTSKLSVVLPKIYGRKPLACINTYGCQQNV